MKVILLFILPFCLFTVFSCNQTNKEQKVSSKNLVKEEVPDKKKLSADEVMIGDQIWMKKNLNVNKFQNGDTIPMVSDMFEWSNAYSNKQPAWCYYNHDPKNGHKYGKLYNWFAVSDPRGLAPKGWHIPSQAEFKVLLNFVELDAHMVVNNDESGRSDLLGGRADANSQFFYELGNIAYWWSSSEYSVYTVDAWFFKSIVTSDRGSGNLLDRTGKGCGFSVRCIKD